jgi:hypothetical protein
VGTVYAGPIFWEATHAKAVMSAYRDFLPTAPEELGVFVGLKTVPSMDPFPKDYWGRRACAVIGSYIVMTQSLSSRSLDRMTGQSHWETARIAGGWMMTGRASGVVHC